MPDASLDQCLREAYASCAGTPIVTLEIRHASFEQPIRVWCGHGNIGARLEDTAPVQPGEWVEWVGLQFDLKRPEVNDASAKELLIAIDNVDRSIGEALEAAADSPEEVLCTFREYLMEDTSRPRNDPPMHLVITRAEAGAYRVEASAGFPDYGDAEFPVDDYTIERFPGLAA